MNTSLAPFRLTPREYTKILQELAKTISEKSLQFDVLMATCIDAVPWACLLGEELRRPVYSIHEGKFYHFAEYHGLDLTLAERCNHMVSDIFSLPFAIHSAYTLGKSILYIKKRTEKENILVGSWKKGDSVCLYETYTQEMKYLTTTYTSFLKEQGLEVFYATGKAIFGPVTLQRKRILLVDDVYHSDNTPPKMVSTLRHEGAIVTDVITLCDRHTPKDDDGLHIHSFIKLPEQEEMNLVSVK